MKTITLIDDDRACHAYVNGKLYDFTEHGFAPSEIADMAGGEPFTLTQIDVHAHDEPEPEPEPPQSIPTGTIDDFAEKYGVAYDHPPSIEAFFRAALGKVKKDVE